MRPLTLKFSGLRSYYDQQEIDFSGTGLFAITGKTGAGKSSILEGICFALYGACTWLSNSAVQLIADGGDGTLAAELTFRAQGNTWKVTRSITRDKPAAGIHRLERLTVEIQNEWTVNATGSTPVRKAVEKLVGLDHKAFLKSVILPQGRFQELLQASDTDRTRILKSILGLEQITLVRNRARDIHDRLLPQLNELRQQRAELPADPAGLIADATERLNAAKQRRNRLDSARAAIAAAQTEANSASAKASECRKAARQLATRIPDDSDGGYRALKDLDATLESELTEAKRQHAEHVEQEASIKAVLDTADNDATGISAVASALATLDSLRLQLPELEDQRRQLTRDESDYAAEQRTLDTHAATMPALAEEDNTAHAAAEAAETAYAAAVEDVEHCRALLRQMKTAARAAGDSRAAALQAAAKARTCDEVAATAKQEAERAELVRVTAEEGLEAVRRANSAAHAATASRAGDPCPVCAHTLPSDFTPPATEGTQQAEQALKAAKKAALHAAQKGATAEAERHTARRDLLKILEVDGDAANNHEEAVAAVRQALGRVDLDHDDNVLLAELFGKRDVVDRERDTARQLAQAAHDARTTAAAQLQQMEKALKARAAALAKSQRAVDQRDRGLTDSNASLPAPYRVTGQLTVEAVQASMTRAQERQRELDALKRQLDAAATQARHAGDRVQMIQDQRRSQVEQPAAKLRRVVDTLVDKAHDAASLLDFPGPSTHPAGADLASEERWATAVIAAGRDIASHCANEAARQDQVAAAAEDAAAVALQQAGVDTDSDLDEAFLEANTTAAVADQQIAAAQSQQTECERLDHAIASVAPGVNSLAELGHLLADGKFPTAAVERRQQALLGIATTILLSMTGDRFGFYSDFTILDAQTGQPRDVKTLSGGETFLASLALALAVVELAARSAGRVEALFLDEGFGTLDADALSEAMEALSQRASNGRLVAVISHMQAVTEYMEEVLVVTKALGGSKAHWASPAEREQLAAADSASGLIA